MTVENNRSEASELDGLPDADRKATQEIIDEIGKDEKVNADDLTGKEADDKAAADVKAKADADAAAAAAAAGKEGKPDDGKQEPPRRAVKLMPSYVHEIAIKDRDKKIDDLTTALEAAKAGKGSESEQQPKPDAEKQAQLEDKVTKLAEEHKLDPKLVKSLVDLGMEYGGKLPADVAEKLKAVDEWKSAQEVQAEEQAYNSAFDEHVVPLIKAEYGEAVATDTIQVIREKMKEKAYSKEFAATPYSVIYKGVDDFRSFTRTTAKSAEQSRGGAHGAGADEGAGKQADDELFLSTTDADIDKMDDATFERFSNWQQSRERGGRRA